MTSGETIAAVATPPGVGAVSLIRVSGPQAEQIARRIFRSPHGVTDFRSHHLYHGHIVSSATGEALDEVLIALMRAPRTFTGEDTLEISCHGGRLVTRAVLAELFKAGARPAAPGEFTRRAFLNGRIDLSQAEAVADLVTAASERGLRQVLHQLDGGLARRIQELEGRILDLIAALEASLDFTAADGRQEEPPPFEEPLAELIGELDSLLVGSRQSEIWRRGFQVVILGRPNVGKSSLLNALLGVPRAIVTPVAGTTRDFIEEWTDIGGVAVRLTDTAGIRPPEGPIEAEGIRQVWERLAEADLALIVLDGSAQLEAADAEIIAANGMRPALVVVNKCDLPRRLSDEELHAVLSAHIPSPLAVSAKYGQGLTDLRAALATAAGAEDGVADATEIALAGVRQRWCVERCRELLAAACEGLRDGRGEECVAYDLREAQAALAQIRGRGADGDVLDRIFARFCLGK